VTDSQRLATLQAENARLVALLDSHGIDWQPPAEPTQVPLAPLESSSVLETDTKITLFRRLFRGRF
jgi:hypothetical protein